MVMIQGIFRSIDFTKKAREIRRKFYAKEEELNTYGEPVVLGPEDKEIIPGVDELPDDDGDIE
jgi:hypothetical protein